MPIRLKLFLGALALTLLTVGFGVYSRAAEHRLSAFSFRLYDDAFMAMSYLREAQNTLLANAVSGPWGEAIDEMQANLDVATKRAMSDRGRAAAVALASELERIRQGGPSAPTARASLHADFDTAVEIFAGDAFAYRRQVGQVLQQTDQGTQVALIASLVLAALITVALTRSIVPQVRRAVGIAQAIAGGALDNEIAPRGQSETAQLLRALGVMQQAIAANIVRVQALMEQQARDHAAAAQQQVKIDKLVQCFGLAIGGVFRGVSAKADQVASTADRLNAHAGEIVATGREAEGRLARSADRVASNAAATRALCEALRVIGQEVAATEAQVEATLAETVAATAWMQQTRKAAGEIEQMVAVINKIAVQTRMLALNTAIEAERAGAAGRGFSVVAGEVKRLAVDTSSAAFSVAERATRIMAAADATAARIEAITLAANEVYALSTSIAGSVAAQDAASELLWSSSRDMAVDLGRARAGVDTTLTVTAGSAAGLADIGGSALLLAEDAARLSGEVAEFLDVVRSVKGGESIDMLALDRPATLQFAGSEHAGRVIAGSGVMVHFVPPLEIATGTVGLLSMDGEPDSITVRVAGCDDGMLQLQPSLARAARERLQTAFARAAA